MNRRTEGWTDGQRDKQTEGRREEGRKGGVRGMDGWINELTWGED